MTRRLSMLMLSTWLTVPSLVLAEDLTPEQMARIRRDEKAAMDKVNAAYGNKKPSELSTEERRQIIREQQEAARGVMEKHGVSAKDYARQTARMGPKGNEAVEAAEKGLEAKEKAAAAAAKTEGNGTEEIQIQQGINEENPVMLEEQEGAPPVVEVEMGLPAGEGELGSETLPTVEMPSGEQ
ncbi:hypothetical protein [Archangium lipolyticum]|uniref:hypothetical protein n=1 Tax=Archangium lipolyticum TaxID=2970465 RepID=UPI00214A07F4|nr:hypothetical protein [Archangium lipolyticum]